MRITAEASRIRVYVIATDEEKMIARYTVKPHLLDGITDHRGSDCH
jgi:acetate kinase